MATLADFKLAVLDILGEDAVINDSDPIEGAITPASVLLSACHAGLLSLSSRYWKSAVLPVEAHATAVEVESPADLIAVEAFYDLALSVFIPRTFFQVGSSITGNQSANSWIDYPHGTVTFSNPLTSGGTIYYSAHWALPTQDDDEIETPNMCLTYLIFYAASYCLMRKASEQGEIKQFATKVDSGTPITLPAEVLSNFFAKRAASELQLIPMKQKGI